MFVYQDVYIFLNQIKMFHVLYIDFKAESLEAELESIWCLAERT